MQRILVWDLPVRFFHWLLAGLFVAAFAIATLADDKSRTFPYHAILGLILVFMVVFRLIWGVIGTRTARFSALTLAPSALARYVRGIFPGATPRRYVAHNPATSWFAIAAFLVLLGLAVTGVLRGRHVEAAEEPHEVLAWTMAGLVALHFAGVFWHSLRHRDGVVSSMVSGRKLGESSEAISSMRVWSAIFFLILTGAWSAALFAGYDGASKRLAVPLLRTPLQLGETEGEKGKEPVRERGEHEKDHNDD